MESEVFDGASMKAMVEAMRAPSRILDDLSDDSLELDHDSEEEQQEQPVESLRRVHLGGAAARVTPFTKLDDYIHGVLQANLAYGDRLPFLVQYLTPLLTAEYDTLLVAPPGRAQIEALMIPIINKILLFLVDGAKCDRKPGAIILSSNYHERAKIVDVINLLIVDLPIMVKEAKSYESLTSFFDFDSTDGKIDILITSPAAYVAFTKKNVVKRDVGEQPKKYPSKIGIERLQYLVIFELEELCDAGGDYSRIIASHRKEKDFTLVLVTHTAFSNRGKAKYLNFEHANWRCKLENLLNEDYGLVMVDSTVAISNIVSLTDSELAKMQHLRAIVQQHMDKYLFFDEGGFYKYLKRLLIVVPNEERARMVKVFLTTSGRYHASVVEPGHILHLERELEYRTGHWVDPMKKMKTGQLIGLISSNIHGVRMAHSVVDKIIFFDIVPDMTSLVLNCSKVVDHRRNIFLLETKDLSIKKKELQSLVQYLKDMDSDVPELLQHLETEPTVVKSIFE